MALVNEHFLKLPNNYLFADIAKKVNAFKVTHPKADIISLGIGDVTQPLCPAVIEAMHKATDEMGTASGFHGYGPEQGYDFLREAILKNDFLPRGVHLDIERSLSTTVPRVTRAISRNSSAGTTLSVLQTLSILSISTRM